MNKDGNIIHKINLTNNIINNQVNNQTINQNANQNISYNSYLNQVKSILTKNKKDIKKDDILNMYEQCFKNFDFIKTLIEGNYGKKIVSELLKHLEYKEFSMNEYIYNPGT